MSLRSALKEHWFLIAGIALPVLVVVFFLAARELPRWWVDPPRFDVLFKAIDYSSPRTGGLAMDLRIRDGAVEVVWTAQAKDAYLTLPRLYRWHASDGSLEEIELPSPPHLEPDEKSRATFVAGLEGMRVDTRNPAPDGYEFRSDSGGGSGLFSGLVYHRYREPRLILSRRGRVVALPDAKVNQYGTGATFLGWLVPGDFAR